MSKIIKKIAIILIFLLISINYVSAVDLNLTEDTYTNTNTSVRTSNITKDSENSSYTNTNNTSNNSTTNKPSATVSTSNVSDSGLSLSDIINIFLIVIGILLILLAIAILIKLKK